jgi:hypothetical protein
MDVNEEIVKTYFEVVKDCLVRDNIPYTNYNAGIDLLAINKRGEVFDIEVKWRGSTIKIEEDGKTWSYIHYKEQLLNKERDDRIKKVTGKYPSVKFLVTTRSHLSRNPPRTIEWWVNSLDKFWDDIIKK